ncbi:MAG: glycosyltransferase family A protein [Bacteroidota bacterium]|nr:glycosyltransferase family A protein [Bacteroidota bacterium]
MKLKGRIATFIFKTYPSSSWYFHLLPGVKGYVPVVRCKIADAEKYPEEAIDEAFDSTLSKELDLGYRLWNKGYMLTDDVSKWPEDTEKPTITDEYRFLRKYYKKAWALNVLFRRILTLHNPFVEISAFIKTRNTKSVELFKNHKEYKDYHSFQSPLAASHPRVSIIIPTLNRYKYLKDVIFDLEKQTVTPHEIIIIDQSKPLDLDFYKQFKAPIKLIVQEGRGQWLARNEAIKQAKSEWLLFFDDDSRVEPNWVEEHIKGVDYFKADISAGVSISKVGDKVPPNYSYFRWADQFDSGNALVHKRVFETVGLYDMQYDKMRMGDGEFGLRAYLQGFKSISHPYASRLHLKVSEGGLRQDGHWDAFHSQKWLDAIPIPSVTFLYRSYFNKLNIKVGMTTGLISATIPFNLKKYRSFLPLTFVLLLLKLPLTLLGFMKSWNISSKMMKEGSKIEKI